MKKVVSLCEVEDVFTYIANDEACLLAVKEFEAGMDIHFWLDKYASLYENISYYAEGLPRIVDSNYQGKSYKGILNFFSLFVKTRNEYQDPFSDPPENSED
jgi:hypothetical protein